MAVVKTHIVLDPKVGANSTERASLLEKIYQTAPLTEINQKRLDRYGILTGLMDDTLLEAVRYLPGVVSVQIDKEHFLR